MQYWGGGEGRETCPLQGEKKNKNSGLPQDVSKCPHKLAVTFMYVKYLNQRLRTSSIPVLARKQVPAPSLSKDNNESLSVCWNNTKTEAWWVTSSLTQDPVPFSGFVPGSLLLQSRWQLRPLFSPASPPTSFAPGVF